MSERKEAFRKGSTMYFTGKPCKYGHVAKRLTKNGTCYECHRKSGSDWKKDNREYVTKRAAEWRSKHPGCSAIACAKYRKANLEKERSRYVAYYAANAEKIREKKRILSIEWAKKNKGKANARNARHKSRKLQATPIWADMNAIKDVYLEAEYFQMHVDHIIPLQGRNVCGLHVWDNLQLLMPRENLSKGNRFMSVPNN